MIESSAQHHAVMITAYPRVHLGLHDLSGVTARAYGGLGLCLEALPTKVVARRSSQGFQVSLSRDEPGLRGKILSALSAARDSGLDGTASIEVIGCPRSHIGLGSTTSVVMASLEATNRLLSWRVGRRELIRMSGRGRTSAIGVNGFFGGACVLDVGQAGHPLRNEYKPSLNSARREPSLLLGTWPMPKDWRAWLAFTELSSSVSEAEEENFFREETPTAKMDTLEQLAIVLHEILPSIIEGNLCVLAKALQECHKRGFKAAQLRRQPLAVQHLLQKAWEMSIPAGLSSLGPTVFIVYPADRDLPPGLLDVDLVGPVRFREEGFEVEYLG